MNGGIKFTSSATTFRPGFGEQVWGYMGDVGREKMGRKSAARRATMSEFPPTGRAHLIFAERGHKRITRCAFVHPDGETGAGVEIETAFSTGRRMEIRSRALRSRSVEAVELEKIFDRG